jgi:dipeptidyl aminopeptidase/acylaminoacyl peptidase
MASLNSPQQAKEILKADSETYSASGHLLFLRQGTLMAQAFDEKTGTVSGEPIRIADNVRINASGFAAFSVSEAGVLAYRTGLASELRAAFFDRNGKQLDPINQTGDNRYPRLSPDDTKIAVQRGGATASEGSDIWIIDAMRGTNSRLTFTPENESFPIWTPDGTRVVYATNKNGKIDIYWKLASGLGEAEEVLKSDQDKYPLDFSPDGKLLLFRMDNQKTGQDMFVLSLADKQIKPFLQGPFNENGGRFSPDGKWIAYFSTESGNQQIYVQPYPPTSAKWQVSVDGGVSVTWARDKKELYFVSADNKMMAVDYTAGAEFKAGIPRMLFQIPASPSNAAGLRFSVSRNGDRFLLPVNESAGERPLTVVLNWVSALKK